MRLRKFRRRRVDDDPLRPFRLTPLVALRMLARAAARRCPNCGGRPLFARWLVMRERCPVCRLRLERGERDYFLGSLTVNLVASETLWALALVLALVLGAGRLPLWELEMGGVVLAVAVPVVMWPITKMVWLAVDLMFRPVRPDELLL